MRELLRDRIEIIKREKVIDERGYFLKAINGREQGLPEFTGEVYLTLAKPFGTRGGHYHNQAKEWFIIIRGEALLVLLDIETGESLELILTDTDPFTIMIPPKIAHIFINNSSSDFLLLAYSNQLYDPSDTIKFTNFNIKR